MGQVPRTNPYLVIGSGRLARHLQHYLTLESIPHEKWDRSSGDPLDPYVALARRVLLLIADDAIEDFLARYVNGEPPLWIHCSGSVITPLAHCAHPLMTFGDELYDLDTYRRIPFICDRGPRGFAELFEGLANPHTTIVPELRPLYHALCTLGGNFTTVLWLKVFREAERRLGIERELFLPYLEQVASNLAHSRSPLTGPLARGDEHTIARHLETLAGDPFEGVYRAFVEAYRKDPIARMS